MAPAPTPTHFTVLLLKLPTRAALTAAHGVPTQSFRMLTIVGAHLDNDVSVTAGWGECSALNEAGYTSEWAEGAFEVLRSGQPFDRSTAPMATAAIEMALLDAELKANDETLADRLGTTGRSAPAGAVVGLGPIPAMLDQIEELVRLGYQRLKIKIDPGRLVAPIEAIRSSFPDIELHVDANGSLRGADLPALHRLRDLGVTVVEQPFAVDDHRSAAQLVGESDIVVAADEAVSDCSDIERLAVDRAATAIVVKPSKLGGLQSALDLLDCVATHDMQASIGGMLESGLGRHLLAALAPLPAFTLTGDLSPAGRWLAEDPFRDITLRKGRIEAPTRPGIAGDPMKTRLERYTVRQAVVVAEAALRAVHQPITTSQ